MPDSSVDVPIKGLYRLGGIYFVYFALLGFLLPYWPLYLQSLGFSPLNIGYLMGLLYATKLVAPSLWGWLADRKISRVRVIQLGAALTFLSTPILLFSSGVVAVACMMFMFSFFWNAILPQVEVITLDSLSQRTEHYSKIRLWGSIGFITATLGGGGLLEVLGISFVPYICVAGTFVLWLTTLSLNDGTHHPGTRQRTEDRFSSMLGRPEVWCFMFVCFFMQLSFGPYYGFMSLLMKDAGYSKPLISLMWSWGVAAEVCLFFVMPALMKRFSLGTLISFALLAASIRWVLTPWFVNDALALFWLQLSHAITFALFHSCCIAWVHQLFPSQLWGRGMALYSTVSYGLGGSLGAMAAGHVWDASQPQLTFYMASCAAVVGLWIYRRFRPAVHV